MNRDELMRLVEGYTDGSLTPAEAERLVALIKEGGGAENPFLRELAFHGYLAQALGTTSDDDLVQSIREGIKAQGDSGRFLAAWRAKQRGRGDAAVPGAKDTKRTDAPRHRSSVRLAAQRRGRGPGPGRQAGLWAIAAAALLGMGLWLALKGQTTRQGPTARRPSPGRADRTGPVRLSEAPIAPPDSSLDKPPRAPAPTPASALPVPPAEVSRPQSPPSIPPVPRERPEVVQAPGREQANLPAESPPRADGLEPARTDPETERLLARVARIEGKALFARGTKGKWTEAVVGISLLSGDRLRTQAGVARLDLGGAAVYVNRGTILRVLRGETDEGRGPEGQAAPPGWPVVRLIQGEVYVDDGGRQVHVETLHGLFSPVGTRFNVKNVPSATIVKVEQGVVRVRARSKRTRKAAWPDAVSKKETVRIGPHRLSDWSVDWVKQAIRVSAGQESRVRRGAVPSRPSPIRRTGTLGSQAGLWMAAVRPFAYQAQGGTFHVDGKRGRDTNPGSARLPWQTVAHAIGRIKAGDTVVFSAGLYRSREIRFGPAGEAPHRMTVFKAASGARVIFTSPKMFPPSVRMRNHVRIEGLWFGGRAGGKQFLSPGGRPVGRGQQIVGCTFFGYGGAIHTGSTERLLIHGNRFVRCGGGQHAPAIRLNGGNGKGAGNTQHVIVDRNIIVGGKGYGILGWHRILSCIITRNFVASQGSGLVMDGSDHLVANNLFWKQQGGKFPAIGALLSGKNILLINNIFGPTSPIKGKTAGNRIQRNAFLEVSPRGEGAIILARGREQAQLGISARAIDNAIAALEKAFSQPVEAIYRDKTIEPAFAQCATRIFRGSPLYRQGRPWFGSAGPVNVGPACAAPDRVDAFWAAFRALGLKDWDRHGKMARPLRIGQ